MIYDQHYEMIFKRKSIRKYKTEKLGESVLKEIETYLASIEPIFPEIKLEMKMVDAKEINNLLPIKAPHYLVVSSEEKEGHYFNVGYVLQMLDLFLSANGIGGCYVGMAKPSRELDGLLEHGFIIAYALGLPDEPLHRGSVDAFKRKTLSEVVKGEIDAKIIEPARLAPSATNSQPWHFVGDKDQIHIYRVKPNLIAALIYNKMNQVDMGIALRHMTVALNHEKIAYVFEKSETVKDAPEIKGYNYVGRLTWNK